MYMRTSVKSGREFEGTLVVYNQILKHFLSSYLFKIRGQNDTLKGNSVGMI